MYHSLRNHDQTPIAPPAQVPRPSLEIRPSQPRGGPGRSPEDAIDRLHKVHHDLGWAILTLLDNAPQRAARRAEDSQPDVELVSVADRRSLIASTAR